MKNDHAAAHKNAVNPRLMSLQENESIPLMKLNESY